jgi:lysophospholipase L1-like esterase
MKRKVPATLVVIAAIAGAMAPAAHAGTHYYLSLGDSLSVGRQPDASGREHNTRDGYVEVVARGLARRDGPIRTLKLGCGGTTTTALTGSPCNRAYGAGSQVQQAERILRAHRSSTALVTVQIGDNDVEGCLSASGIRRDCFDSRLATMRRNLLTIGRRLRKAAGSRVPLIGVADYDQFLAYWLRGGSARRIAVASIRFIGKLNATMGSAYRSAHLRFADAAGRFATPDLHHYVSLGGHGRVPLDVARVCTWTWACDRPPRGPDDHAKHQGYRAIGLAVLDALPAPPSNTSGGAGTP